MDNTNGQVEAATNPWWLLLVQGIFAIILGAILLWAPAKTQANTWIILAIVLGIYWMIDGFMGFARLVQTKKGRAWKIFTSIVSILAGGYILVYPAAAAAALPSIALLVLGIWGCMHGVIRIASAFQGAGWAAAVVGVLMIILGAILIVNFANPSYSLTLLYVAAATIFVMGFVWVYRAFRHQPTESAYVY